MEALIAQVEQALLPYKVYDTWSVTFRYYNDMAWYWQSLIGAFPLFMLAFYRMLYPPKDIDSYNDKYHGKFSFYTVYAKILVVYAPVYYIVDLAITIWENRVFEWCRIPFFFHHIVSIVPLYLINNLNYIPGYVLLLGAWHALLLKWPLIFAFNIPYVLIIFYFHYCLYQRPYTNLLPYRFTKRIMFLFYFAIALIGLYDCQNILPYL